MRDGIVIGRVSCGVSHWCGVGGILSEAVSEAEVAGQVEGSR